MKKSIRKTAIPILVCGLGMLTNLGSPNIGRAETHQAANWYGRAFWAGGDYQNYFASFPYQSGQRVIGAGAFLDYHLPARIGLEGEAGFLRWDSYHGESEASYLAGPRYTAGQWGRFQFYGQCLAGYGHMHYPYKIGDKLFFALAPGGGINYRFAQRWTIRGGYEYQLWFGSPGYANEPDHQLNPNGLRVGLAFRLRH